MGFQKKNKQRAQRREYRVRNTQSSRGEKLRVSVFRSLNQIYAQIIDDSMHKTIVSASSITLKDASGDKKTIAKQVGLELGKLAKEKGVSEVFFDRGRFLYHGRVSALADGLREGGLKF